MGGFGGGTAGGFGFLPFGGYSTISLLAARAVSDNVVQLQFSAPVYFSGVLDANDASVPQRYAVQPIGGVGENGVPSRPVSVVAVAVGDGQPQGSYLLVSLDRPMTPYPARYSVTVTGVVGLAGGVPLAPNPTTLPFDGLYRVLVRPNASLPTPGRDLSNPQTFAGASDPLPNPGDPLVLGTFPVDDTGDYAFSAGIQGFKKRVYRRLITVPGGFVHLGENYGVGITRYGKKLGTAARRNQLAAAVESQVSLEPEVSKVVCTVLTSTQPGFFGLALAIRLKTGQVVKWQGSWPAT